MKIGIIDIGWTVINSLAPLSGPLGGSETWMVQISKYFSKAGNDVDIYCRATASEAKLDDTNITVYSPDDELSAIAHKHYDFIILNRFFIKNNINYIKFIKERNIADHLYIQMHDLSFMVNGEIVTNPDVLFSNGVTNDFVNVVALNEWHKNNFVLQYSDKLNNIICIPNGLDLSLFSNCNNEDRDNGLLWSSCEERGLDILVNDIYPIVKKEIPDFHIDIAGYNTPAKGFEELIEGKDVYYLGKLSKSQLYAEQQKHKAWFYPGTFAETFCITLLENILNGCIVVSPITYGMRATLGEYSGFIAMKNRFAEENKSNAINEASQRLIAIFKNPYKRPSFYEEIVHKIQTEYNWTHSCDLYAQHFSSITHKQVHKEQSKYKAIFLAMFCNQKFFKDSYDVVKNTWAKDLIDKQYPGYAFYGFTACDEEHPNECIEGNTVYVNTGDGYFDTYNKMRRAYRLLQELGETADYIFRTNTSTYVNVPKVIQAIENAKENDIVSNWAGYYLPDDNGEYKFAFNIACGNGYIMSRNTADKIFYRHVYNDANDRITDDVVVSKILDKFNIPYNTKYFVSGDIQIPRYKSYRQEDEEELCKKLNNNITDIRLHNNENVDIVNNYPCVSVRSMYDGDERASIGCEYSHMYELHAEYLNSKEKKHFKVLFLAMSCNEPFFVLERKAVEQTWAKELINGYYGDDYAFFSYTACNEEHPNECIEGSTIYVKTGDDLDHTFEKSIRAINYLISQGYTFDRLVRTNTSVFVNVNKVIEAASCWNEYTVWSNYTGPIMYNDSVIGNFIAGWCFSVSWKVINTCLWLAMSGLYYDLIKDILTKQGVQLFDDAIFGCYIAIANMDLYQINGFSIDYKELGVWHYKCIPNSPVLRTDVHPGHSFLDRPEDRLVDPKEINLVLCAQVRNWGIHEARWLEIEHMQELYDALER